MESQRLKQTRAHKRLERRCSGFRHVLERAHKRIHVHPQLTSPFSHSLNDLLHDFGMSGEKEKEKKQSAKYSWPVLVTADATRSKPGGGHLQGWTEHMAGGGRCGWFSMVTVFFTWSWLMSSYICSTVRGCLSCGTPQFPVGHASTPLHIYWDLHALRPCGNMNTREHFSQGSNYSYNCFVLYFIFFNLIFCFFFCTGSILIILEGICLNIRLK